MTYQTGDSVIVTNGGGDNTYAIAQANCLVSGRKYKIVGQITPTFSGSYTFRVRAGGSGTQWSITSGLTSGQAYSFNTGTITADGTGLEIGSLGGGMTQFIIENITVLDQTDMDQSEHARPWQIVGTIKKNPVAPNAELCAYSGWSTGDYMLYNGVTGPGTADFCVMFWCRTPNTSPGVGYFHAWSHGTSSTGGQNSSSGFTIKAYNNNSTGFAWYPYSGNGSQSSDFSLLHLVAGGTADRGLKIGTGRATGANQNDGAVFYDAINSESNEYGSQHIFRRGGHNNMVIGYQSNNYVGINNDYPDYELSVKATDTNESTIQILAGGNGKESNLLFGAPDDADVGAIKYYKEAGLM